MNFSWQIFIDLGLISAALLLATLIRAKVRFFQRCQSFAIGTGWESFGFSGGGSVGLTCGILAVYLVFVLLACALLSQGRGFKNSFLFYRTAEAKE
jgi:hypothetical protein